MGATSRHGRQGGGASGKKKQVPGGALENLEKNLQNSYKCLRGTFVLKNGLNFAYSVPLILAYLIPYLIPYLVPYLLPYLIPYLFLFSFFSF